jgi:hypothetical protein
MDIIPDTLSNEVNNQINDQIHNQISNNINNNLKDEIEKIKVMFKELVDSTINLVLFNFIDYEALLIFHLNIRYLDKNDSYDICLNKYIYLKTCISNLMTYYELISNKDRMQNVLENNTSMLTNE